MIPAKYQSQIGTSFSYQHHFFFLNSRRDVRSSVSCAALHFLSSRPLPPPPRFGSTSRAPTLPDGSSDAESQLQPRLKLPLCSSYCLLVTVPLGRASGICNSTDQTPVTYLTPHPPSQTSSRVHEDRASIGTICNSSYNRYTFNYQVPWPISHAASQTHLPSVHRYRSALRVKYPVHPTHQDQTGNPEKELEFRFSTAQKSSKAST